MRGVLEEGVGHDAGWAGMFRSEANGLEGLLTRVLVAAHHIGSTVVPGLAAKPVIDILLEVRSGDHLDGFDVGMEDLGDAVKGEYERRALAGQVR